MEDVQRLFDDHVRTEVLSSIATLRLSKQNSIALGLLPIPPLWRPIGDRRCALESGESPGAERQGFWCNEPNSIAKPLWQTDALQTLLIQPE